MTPLNYFKIFWSDDIINLLVEQTNLYSVQQTGSSINTNKSEMEQFIGIQMLMSIVSLPAYYMYWAVDTKYSPIADIMSINRYKKMRQYIHCNDNSKRNSKENQDNKLYKIEPVLNMVRENCTKIEPEVNQSIDEQIIPAKTSHSGIRQYNPKKPKKWGFKNFVRAGEGGIRYDFFLYSGSTSKLKCTASNVVMKLLETLQTIF